MSKPHSRLFGMALLLVLVAAPLPLACVREGPRAVLAALQALLLLATLVVALRGKLELRLPFATLPLVLFAAVAAAQLLPIVTPPSERGAAVLGGVEPVALSLVPARTLPRLGEIVASIATFVVAGAAFARVGAARWFCAALLALGAGLSIHAVLAQHGVVPLVDPAQTTHVAVGTYVNRNHLAGLLELALLAGVGLLASRGQRHVGPAGQVWVLGGLAACLLGIVATESRGGLVALCAGLVALFGLARGARAWQVGAVVAVALCVLLLAPESLIARFLGAPSELGTQGTRPDIWLGGLRLLLAFPWLGTGLGTYGDLSPATQPPAVSGRIEHAHCDVLELFAETGFLGGLLVCAAATVFVVRVGRRVRDCGDRERCLLGAGLLAGVVALLVHGLVDFNLQVPANAAWFAAVAGAAAGIVGARMASVVGRRALACACVLVVAVAGASLHRAAAHDRLDGAEARAAAAVELPVDARAAAGHARSALACNSFSPRAWQLLGAALLREGDRAEAQAAAAFENALAWTNPHGRASTRLAIATECLVAGATRTAASWLEPLLGADGELRGQTLERLWALAPIYEIVRELVPNGPKPRADLARFLLQKGEFYGRERELAALRGRPDHPAELTVSDGLLLLGHEVVESREAEAKVVTVSLRFAPGAGPQRAGLVLRLDGESAASYRSFTPEGERYEWSFRLDAGFPPGRYDLSLDFAVDAPRFPLGTVPVDESVIEVRAPARLAADKDLYWSTADRGRRQRPAAGVPLASGDRLWRRLRVPKDGLAVSVRGIGAESLEVRFAGKPLARQPVHGGWMLSASEAGLLEISARKGMDAVVRELVVTGGAER